MELTQLMRIFVDLGITKVRLTGGEPLVRKDLEQIVQMIASFPQINDLSITTNAQGLAERLPVLHHAGLRRVNISLDSLDADRYRRMTRGGELDKVLDSIHAAVKENMTVKINTVLVRGENDTEIGDFIALARDYPVDVRFIELMPFSTLGAADGRRVSGSEILERYPFLHPVEVRDPSQPAKDYCGEGFAGRVGLINPVSHKFCNKCSRVRLTSDGKLRMCLGQDEETVLRPWLCSTGDSLKQVIREAIYQKPEEHSFCSAFHATRAMNQIGG